MTAGNRLEGMWLSVDWDGYGGTELKIRWDADTLPAIRDEILGFIDGMRHDCLTLAVTWLMPVLWDVIGLFVPSMKRNLLSRLHFAFGQGGRRYKNQKRVWVAIVYLGLPSVIAVVVPLALLAL